MSRTHSRAAELCEYESVYAISDVQRLDGGPSRESQEHERRERSCYQHQSLFFWFAIADATTNSNFRFLSFMRDGASVNRRSSRCSCP